MKILFVAMAESIHNARWIHQLKDEGWDLYLFPSHDYRVVHSELDGINICVPFFFLFGWFDKIRLGKYFRYLYGKIVFIIKKISPEYYEKRLNRYIKSINLDIIHSMETQGGDFLVAKVKCENQHASFPVWWHTNRGSDIFY